MNKRAIEIGIMGEVLSGSKIEMHSRQDNVHSSLEGEDRDNGVQTAGI
jgi:hypothetical protein